VIRFCQHGRNAEHCPDCRAERWERTIAEMQAVDEFRAEQARKERVGFAVGDRVEKVGGDYTFAGVVVAAFTKLSGQVRYVVEDDRGVLFIFSDKNLSLRP
jgi:hypothetical protein